MSRALFRLLAAGGTVVALFFGAAGAAYCAEDGESGEAEAAAASYPPFGAVAREWLALQRSGQAAGRPVPMYADVADRVYDRYVKSFTYLIPQTFERKDLSFRSGTGR